MTFRGFAYEGERRSAILDPLNETWKTATFLSLLDTDWALRAIHPRLTRWDEMLNRHQKEREELLRWESAHPPKQIHKTASTETLRLAKEKSESKTLPGSVVNISELQDKGKQKETSAWTDIRSKPIERSSSPSATSINTDNESWYNSDFEIGSQAPPPSSSSSSRGRALGHTLTGIAAPPLGSESDAETDGSWASSNVEHPFLESIRDIPSRARSATGDSDWDLLDPSDAN